MDDSDGDTELTSSPSLQTSEDNDTLHAAEQLAVQAEPVQDSSSAVGFTPNENIGATARVPVDNVEQVEVNSVQVHDVETLEATHSLNIPEALNSESRQDELPSSSSAVNHQGHNLNQTNPNLSVHAGAAAVDQLTASTTAADVNRAPLEEDDEMELFVSASEPDTEPPQSESDSNADSVPEDFEDMNQIPAENAIGIWHLAPEADLDAVDEASSDNDDPAERVIQYDQNVPAAHSYLGSDLEEVHGRVIFDEGSVITLLAYVQKGVILVPGQTMPLHVYRPAVVAMLRTVIENQKTIAILHVCETSPLENYSPLAPIGTTAQVLSISTQHDDPAEMLPSVKAITVGRQRFELLDVGNRIDGILSVKVKILPEIPITDPLDGAIPPSHYKPRAFQQPICNGSQQDTANQKPQPRRVHNSCCYLTQWPDWVYRQYSSKHLMCQVREELNKWGGVNLETVSRMESPEHMSYWLAANLPISDADKINILALDSCIQRLRKEVSLMRKFVSLCCSDCSNPVANRSDVFSLSYEGPMGTYVNPQGHIHEMLTVYKAKHLTLRGEPSSEYSWFPGYAWTIVNCRNCGQHKGWKFTATSASLQPSYFYGLTRAGVRPGTDPNSLMESFSDIGL